MVGKKHGRKIQKNMDKNTQNSQTKLCWLKKIHEKHRKTWIKTQNSMVEKIHGKKTHGA